MRCVENSVCWVCFCISRSNKEYSVMLGSSKLQPEGSSRALKIPVADIIVHPKYWGRNFIRSDIALLRLESPVTFNKHTQPICLPEQGFNLKAGTQCWVTGWGKIKQHSSGKLNGFGNVPLGLHCPIPCVPSRRLWLWFPVCGLECVKRSSYGAHCYGSHRDCSRAKAAWAGWA